MVGPMAVFTILKMEAKPGICKYGKFQIIT